MFKFDEDVALQTILYIANRVKNPTFHKISKIIYFADRFHLEKYGRFICGDSYVAMKHGPVPSRIYDILKDIRANIDLPIVKKAKDLLKIENYDVKPLEDADLDYFSDSDIVCLDKSIEQYGDKTFSQLTNLSHDEAWHSAGENDFIEIQDIVKTFKNPETLLEHLRDPHPG